MFVTSTSTLSPKSYFISAVSRLIPDATTFLITDFAVSSVSIPSVTRTIFPELGFVNNVFAYVNAAAISVPDVSGLERKERCCICYNRTDRFRCGYRNT